MITQAILRKVRLNDVLNLRGPVLESENPLSRIVDCDGSERLSKWAQSPAKRVFDFVVVLAILPVLLPLCLTIACLVRFTSGGPAFFLQKRVGRYGSLFTIYKFRTMSLLVEERRRITTIDNPTITTVGRFLRWWKLDELPQFFNVLLGDMSLVGPRPKVPEQQTALLMSRPGVTGAATLAFAQEEVILAGIPEDRLEEFFRNVLLPLKSSLDANYMAKATLLSDLRLLQRTAMRRWNRPEIAELLAHTQDDSDRSVRILEPGLGLGD